MAKGIIIDVGFAADIKNFVNEIEKQFKNIDFSDSIGLSKAFEKQVKDVRSQLTELKDEIDQTINGKIKDDPSKQIQNLNNSVSILASSFKEMLKVMPMSNTSKLTAGLDSIISDINELSAVCDNASDAVKKVSDAAGGKIEFVDTNQLEELEKLYKVFNKLERAAETINTGLKKSGKTSYKDEDEVLRDIIETYKIYMDIQDKMFDLEENDTIADNQKIRQLDMLNQQYIQISITLQRLMKTFGSFKDSSFDEKIEISDGFNISVGSIRENIEEEFDNLLTYISKRKAEIQTEVYSLGGGSLADAIEEANHQSKKNRVTVPLDISTKSSTLAEKALNVIRDAQDKIVDNPLEVEVRLLSSYKSKANQKILKEIMNGIQNIDDEEIKTKTLSLIDDMNKQIDNALLFNVNVNTERATNAVRNFVTDAKEELIQLSQTLAPLEPEIILTEEHRQAFQKQLDEAKGEFKIQIGIMDGDDTIDNNATKKELSYLKLLRERVEAVSNAVNEKSLAFIDEEGIVKDVVINERDYLNQLYGDLISIEAQIKDIVTAFSLLPTTFKMDFDDSTLESLDKLANHEALARLSDVKKLISTAISSKSGDIIEIPEEQKEKLLKNIQKLSNEINTIFETEGMNNWTSNFLSSLDEISQKIKHLFGNNALNDMIENWNFSDEIMIDTLGKKHLRERAAVIDENGKIYGSGTYDQEGSTRFIRETIAELQSKGVVPKIGVHSHSSDRIVASSLPQGDMFNASYADLGSNYISYIKRGIEKQLTVALNDIELFDAKGFYDSNKSVDFGDSKIRNLIRDKADEIRNETTNNFYQYFEQFVTQYGSGNGLNLKEELFDNIHVKSSGDKFKSAIQNIIDPEELLNNFYKQTKINKNKDIGHILAKALDTSFSPSQIDIQSLGYSKEEANQLYKEFRTNIFDNAKKILDNTFDISKFDYTGNARDLFTFNYRQITPRILEEALQGTGYKNNYQDFMKTYTTEDFIKQNPLGLSSGTLSDLFDIAAPTTFLETLDKIVADLKEIKDISMGDSIQNAFSVKIDNESVNRFAEEINRLIESIEKLPKIITNAFSSFESVIPKDPITEIDKEIQKLTDDIKETENQIKALEDQLFGSKIKNKSVDNVVKTQDNIQEKLNINSVQNNIVEEELQKLREKHNLLTKQVELLKEQKKLLLGGSTQGSTTGIDSKTNAFKIEGATVDTVVDGEIDKLYELEKKLGKVTEAVNKKTEAFKNEGKIVGEVIDGEVSQLNPLQSLESAYNVFKPFYDDNNLESEEGAKAALSYYNAYKEALTSKVNKKDLKQYTIGKESDLFTGNYANYKKGTVDLDLSGLNSQIAKYQEIIDKFNQPEVISIINSLTEAIQKLLETGNTSQNATKLLIELNKAINNLGGKNSADKIAKIATNLENFQKSIQTLDISDSGFISSISSILEKGEELKALGEVLKSTKKQIDAATKEVKAEDNLKQSQKYLEQYKNDINAAVSNKYGSENVLYQQLQATKDGVVQVTAMVKEGENAYKKYILTTTNGSDLMEKAVSDNAAVLAKEVKQWESYQRTMANAIPGAKNLGKDGESFTPESDGWDKLIQRANEFGIELEDIVKVLRNVDREGYESFQIFTKLSRITLGMDSKNVLFQNDAVLDKNAIENFKKDIKNLQNALQNSFKGNDVATKDFLNTLDEISNKWAHLNKLHDKKIISDAELQDLQEYYDAFKTTLSSISLDKISTNKKTPEFLEQLKQAKDQLITLKDVLDKVDAGQPFSNKDIEQVKLFISQVRTLYNTMGDKENKLADSSLISKTLGKIADILEKNSAMSNNLKTRFRELSAEIKSFGDNIPADKMKEFTNRLEALKAEMLETGQTGLSFFDGIWKRAKSMSQSFISMYLSLWDVIRYIRTGVTYITEIDTAFTEMRKVSDETISSLKNFQKESFDIAESVGTTAVQIQNSTADWMRLGESIQEAAESAEVSNILLNVSEFESIDEATDSLVAMSAAYDDLNKMEIVDKLNEVGNNYAISTDGIATALQKSASALTTAGNSMDEAVALVTAGNAVVQDPDSVGAGLRTIALRLTGTKESAAELEELGEDTEGVITTVSKLRDTIMSATAVASNGFEGFDIFDENGNYKSTYEILKGISEVYQEIVETDKKTGNNNKNLLLETIAGKNRANIAASILQNPELLTSVYDSSANADGSAEEELDKYLDSIEGKISQFKNELQEFWHNLISSDTIKGFIDFGTEALNILGNIVDFLGEIGTLATVAGTALGVHLFKNNNSGGRAKLDIFIKSVLIKYATESFSREVYEALACISM